MNNLDDIKRKYLRHLASVASFKNSWPNYRQEIDALIPQIPTGQSLFQLGDSLSKIFRAKVIKGRGQGTVSSAGASWECLLMWYLNLVFWETPLIAVRKNQKFVPSIISDVLTVTISNNSTNSESDINIFSVPDVSNFSGSTVEDLNRHLSNRISDLDLVVLQCKTNWNDNAQIPMLWDMVYNSNSSPLPNVSVGIRGVGPSSCKSFKYAFATVPTGGEEQKPTSVAVTRVRNLTGGNYWGWPSKQGVALSLTELPGKLFINMFPQGVSNHIDNQLQNKNYFDSFINLHW